MSRAVRRVRYLFIVGLRPFTTISSFPKCPAGPLAVAYCYITRSHETSRVVTGAPIIPGAPVAGCVGNPFGGPCRRSPRGGSPAMLRHGDLAGRGGPSGAAGASSPADHANGFGM